MFRPNPIGLSVVELESIERKDNKIVLNILGGDFLDGTPVLDIKPYIPYVDSIDTATAGYANKKPEIKFDVIFTRHVKEAIEKENKKHTKLSEIIREILQLDPRPAYQNTNQSKNEFAIKLYNYDLKWRIDNNQIIVTDLIILE